jgi:Zn-dependent protease with chaperone function
MARRAPWRLWALVVLAVGVAGAAPARAVAATADDQEIQIGRRAAAQIEARLRIVTEPAVADRVSRLGAIVAAQSHRPRLPYTFKVVQIDDVNAVALPGGFIYVTTGLLRFVRSDHELAAVLAHEVAHAALGHGMEMQRRANQAMFVTLLIGVLTRDPNVFQGSVLFARGLLAGYTRDLEREADLASIDYLHRTPYSPVAVLTVLERLWRREQLSPQPPVVFPDHPTTAERVQYVEEALRARRIPLNRRTPANYLVLTVREGADAGGTYAEILVNDRLIVRLADAGKIREAAEVLDRLFDSDLNPYEVTARETPEGWGVFGRGFPILRLTPRDVPTGSAGLRDAVTGIAARLRAAIEDDIRRRRFDG